MSILVQRKKMPLSDLKIKFRFFLRRVSDGYFEFFPIQTPGDFNSPLGKNKAVKWVKYVKKKDKLMALFAALIASPVGWWGVFENQYDILAWFFVIWGALGVLTLLSKTDENALDNTKEISNLKVKNKAMKNQIKNLEDEIKEIKKQLKI